MTEITKGVSWQSYDTPDGVGDISVTITVEGYTKGDEAALAVAQSIEQAVMGVDVDGGEMDA